MWLQWSAIAILTLLFLIVVVEGARNDLLGRSESAVAINSLPTFWRFIKYIAFYTSIHIYFCSLILRAIPLWRLGIAWFILSCIGGGWLYSSFLKPKLPPAMELVGDFAGVFVAIWIVNAFVVP